MEFVKTFAHITQKDASLAGGKGASLGEMVHAGIPVPSGFVILSEAYRQFVSEMSGDSPGIFEFIDQELQKVNLQDARSLEQVSTNIRKAFLEKPFPDQFKKEILATFQELQSEYVAVRSSATAEDSSTASWAGELETYLNTTEATLFENIKRCWSSLFTPRAIFYCLEKKMDLKSIAVPVVVQQMVQSEVSGIAFTVHPVTQDRDQIIIEAGFGLGEAIVGGYITPDSYIIQKSTLGIVEITPSVQEKKLIKDISQHSHTPNVWIELSQETGGQQKLTSEKITELAHILKKIEDHYGFPCDIEWAYEAGKFYITQSRPITTLQ